MQTPRQNIVQSQHRHNCFLCRRRRGRPRIPAGTADRGATLGTGPSIKRRCLGIDARIQERHAGGTPHNKQPTARRRRRHNNKHTGNAGARAPVCPRAQHGAWPSEAPQLRAAGPPPDTIRVPRRCAVSRAAAAPTTSSREPRACSSQLAALDATAEL
jgi:hypothetical protein